MVCCAGVALLPPSFDGLPDAGVSCLDFRGLLPAAAPSQCANLSANSASWWSKLPKLTPASCHREGSERLVRLVAAVYAGFGLPGDHVFGAACPQHLVRDDVLVMHVRSGDIFGGDM